MDKDQLSAAEWFVEESGLFDKRYYREMYYDVVKDEPDLIMHYLKEGAELGFDPSPIFDSALYTNSVDGLKDAGLSPLVHYIKFGREEMRPSFSLEVRNPVCVRDAYTEWCESSRSQKKAGWETFYYEKFLLNCSEFDAEYYERISGLAKEDKLTQIRHYLNTGMYGDMNPSRLFDIRYYVNQYGAQCPMKVPFIHYIKKGRKQGFKGIDADQWDKQARYLKRLRREYYRFKEGYQRIEDYFGGKISMSGVLWSHVVDDIKKSMSYELKLRLHVVEKTRDIEREHQLKAVVARKNLPYEVCVFPESEEIRDNEFIWDVTGIGETVISDLLPLLAYCAGEGVLGVLLERGERARGEIIPAVKIAAEGNIMDEIPVNQCVFRKGCGYFKEETRISWDVFQKAVAGGQVIHLYHPAAENIRKDKTAAETDRIQSKNQIREHTDRQILISIYAFSYGGGEIMPIRLANQLKKMGCPILVHIYQNEREEEKVRKMLLPTIPVVRTDDDEEMALILREHEIEVISSHHQAVQSFIARIMRAHPEIRVQTRHVATSHGMYNAFSEQDLSYILDGLHGGVDCWTYVADRNLEPFQRAGYDQSDQFVKIPNGMERPQTIPIPRSSMGIEEDAFVFCLASRAIPEKGWKEAAEVIAKVRESTGRNIHLILIGDGPLYKEMLEGSMASYIHLAGFRDNPCDYYASSDAMILLSYYASESAPLSLIEALQCGLPVIASDIGDIRQMLTKDGNVAGEVIALEDGRVSIDQAILAVQRMVTNPEYYECCRTIAMKKAHEFDIKTVAEQYLDVFDSVCRRGND